jgi:hypothetical protein
VGSQKALFLLEADKGALSWLAIPLHLPKVFNYNAIETGQSPSHLSLKANRARLRDERYVATRENPVADVLAWPNP